MTRDTQTQYFKDIDQRICYDYNFGHNLVKEFGVQVEPATYRDSENITDIRMVEVMSGEEY